MNKRFEVTVRAFVDRVVEVHAENSEDALAEAEKIANTPNSYFKWDDDVDSEWKAVKVEPIRNKHEQDLD